MTTAVATFDAVKALHVIAAFAAYGLPAAYPVLLPYLRRHHPRALPGVHDVQHRLNIALTGPGTVALFLLGAYMASEDDLWGETYVTVPVAIVGVIAVAGGAIVRWTGQLAQPRPRRRGGGRSRRRRRLRRRLRAHLPPLHGHRGPARRARRGGDLLHGRQALRLTDG